METATATRDTSILEGADATPVVRFSHVSLAFDDKVILEDLSFALYPGRMKIVLGASGAGKSTILRLILGLLKPDGGEIYIAGQRIDGMREEDLMDVRAHLGMVFQEGALFDSLTVGENVGYRLRQEMGSHEAEIDARVDEMLGYVGLAEQRDRMPSELSGGQRRRVAIARALASRPRIILYDEPTTGLDPITALTIDAEIVKLRDLEDVSSIVVTHQLRDAFYIATHEAVAGDDGVRFGPASAAKVRETEFVMLRNGRIAFEGDAQTLRATGDEYLKAFLS